MLMLAFFVGVLTALAGLLLKWLIHQIEYLLTNHFSITGANWLYLLYPVVGILITGLFVPVVYPASAEIPLCQGAFSRPLSYPASS